MAEMRAADAAAEFKPYVPKRGYSFHPPVLMAGDRTGERVFAYLSHKTRRPDV